MRDEPQLEVLSARRALTGERVAVATSASRPAAGLLVMCAMVGVLLLVTLPASATGLALLEETAAAVSDSHTLPALLEDARRHLRPLLKLDHRLISAHALTELESSQRAAGMTRAAGGIRYSGGGRAVNDPPETDVRNNMTASANGKQLSTRLELSRAATGNLLFKNITPN